jgi:hypothetical protein
MGKYLSQVHLNKGSRVYWTIQMSWCFCISSQHLFSFKFTFHFLCFGSTQISGAYSLHGFFLRETGGWSATGLTTWLLHFILLQMCFGSIYSTISAKDLSTLTCPNWFSALTSISSRLINLHSRSSDLTCRRNAVSNLYVSSALPRGDRHVSEGPMHSDQWRK